MLIWALIAAWNASPHRAGPPGFIWKVTHSYTPRGKDKRRPQGRKLNIIFQSFHSHAFITVKPVLVTLLLEERRPRICLLPSLHSTSKRSTGAQLGVHRSTRTQQYRKTPTHPSRKTFLSQCIVNTPSITVAKKRNKIYKDRKSTTKLWSTNYACLLCTLESRFGGFGYLNYYGQGVATK